MEETEDIRVSAFGGADDLEREPPRYFIYVDLDDNPEYRENLAARARDEGLEVRLIAKPFGAYFTSPEDCEMHISIFKAGDERLGKVVLRLICGDSNNFAMKAHSLLGPSCAVDEPTTSPAPNRLEVIGSRSTQPARARTSSRRSVVIQGTPNPGLVKTPFRVDYLCGRNGRPRTTPGTSNPCLASWPGNKVVDDFIDEHIQAYADSTPAGRRALEDEVEHLVYKAGGRFLEPVYKDRVPNNEAVWMQVGGQQWMRQGVKAPTRKRPPTAKTVIREKFKYTLRKYLQGSTDESNNLVTSSALQLVPSASTIQQAPGYTSAPQQLGLGQQLVESTSVPSVLTSTTQLAQDQTNSSQQQGLEQCFSEFSLVASKGVQPALSRPTQRARGQSNVQQHDPTQSNPISVQSLMVRVKTDCADARSVEPLLRTERGKAGQESCGPPLQPTQGHICTLQQLGPEHQSAGLGASVDVQPALVPPTQSAHGDTNPVQQLSPQEPNLDVSSASPLILSPPIRQARGVMNVAQEQGPESLTTHDMASVYKLLLTDDAT